MEVGRKCRSAVLECVVLVLVVHGSCMDFEDEMEGMKVVLAEVVAPMLAEIFGALQREMCLPLVGNSSRLNVLVEAPVEEMVAWDLVLLALLISKVMIVASSELMVVRRQTFVGTLEEISGRFVRLDCSLVEHDCMAKVGEAAPGRETMG